MIVDVLTAQMLGLVAGERRLCGTHAVADPLAGTFAEAAAVPIIDARGTPSGIKRAS